MVGRFLSKGGINVKVIIYGEEYTCIKAIKGSNFVELYDESENLIASFSGISDFSEYVVKDGEWSLPIPTTEQRVSDLEEQLAQADEVSISLYEALQEQETINIQQDEALVNADETAINLYESQQEQETINAQQDEALMEIYEMLG